MKLIDISTKKHPNTFTKVDDCDYDELSRYKWGLQVSNSTKSYVRRGTTAGGQSKNFKMHIEILGKKKGMIIDHINRDALDNQRHNLRHCTKAENTMNTKLRTDNSSGYRGVHWNKSKKKWYSHIEANRNRIYIGTFNCLVKAAKAYDKAAIKYHGDFASLNFPNKI